MALSGVYGRPRRAINREEQGLEDNASASCSSCGERGETSSRDRISRAEGEGEEVGSDVRKPKAMWGREGSTEREAMKITGGVAEEEDKRMREINGQVLHLNSDVGERERERITSWGYTMLPSLPVSASGDFGEEGLLMSV